jgi:hypothetical protein
VAVRAGSHDVANGVLVIVIVIRGATGSVLWARQTSGPRKGAWVCLADKTRLPSPTTPDELRAFVGAMMQHSQAVVGALVEATQLQL